MREYKIAICDDEEYYLEELYTYIRTYANEREVKIVCDRYSSGWDIANKVEEDGAEYDMVFLIERSCVYEDNK